MLVQALPGRRVSPQGHVPDLGFRDLQLSNVYLAINRMRLLKRNYVGLQVSLKGFDQLLRCRSLGNLGCSKVACIYGVVIHRGCRAESLRVYNIPREGPLYL